jgi:hypothetical protein
MELLWRVEVNLGLKFRPLIKSLPCEEHYFGLDALKLSRCRSSRSVIQVPNVQVQIALTTPAIAVIAMLTVGTQSHPEPRGHRLWGDADVDRHAFAWGNVQLRKAMGSGCNEVARPARRYYGAARGPSMQSVSVRSLKLHACVVKWNASFASTSSFIIHTSSFGMFAASLG